MNSATVFRRFPITNYSGTLGGGSARINNRGLRWDYDSELVIYSEVEDTSLVINTQNGSVTNSKHTERATIRVSARYYFVEGLSQPHGLASISGSKDRNDEYEVDMALYRFERNDLYSRYLDMLRNEEPLWLKFVTEIDHDVSHFRTQSNPMELLPLDEISITGLASMWITMNNEEVGEGELL